jgi:hypothetical protein
MNQVVKDIRSLTRLVESITRGHVAFHNVNPAAPGYVSQLLGISNENANVKSGVQQSRHQTTANVARSTRDNSQSLPHVNEH